ncbi:MAG: sodium:calcium antiporter [Thermoanaerobaculia bacterium]|nr:sodium:calcium antiporter [Thermoanaerobaculia bacterium]
MIPDLSTLPLFPAIAVFVGSAIVIGFVGVRLVSVTDRLADATGWGEAIFGALFLGAATSLSGIVTSVTAAWEGFPVLAVSNALGGIAAQTVFLSFADIAYRKSNLEHAAASAANIMQSSLLISLLAAVLVAFLTPDVAYLGIHPITPLLLAGYIYGLRMIRQAHEHPMWHPHITPYTRNEEDDAETVSSATEKRLWIEFALLAPAIGFAGWTITQSAVSIVTNTGISETVVGGLFTAVSTSLPELVAALAAVRRGALTLAVGNVIGGNAFDTLFVAVADVAFRDGSIYHAITSRELFLIALTILMIGVFLMGLTRREKRGIGNIGFESFLILVLYGFGMTMLVL